MMNILMIKLFININTIVLIYHHSYLFFLNKVISNIPNIFNIGVDINIFRPITLDELILRNTK